MDRINLLLLCQFQLWMMIVTSQSTEFFPFLSSNSEMNEDFLHTNHSIDRRQVSLNILTSQPARIPIMPSYMILAPRVIRPAQIISISVTILRKTWTSIMVKALIANDQMAVASAEDLFMVNVPHTLKMNIPKNIGRGTYRLTIEGKSLTGERKFYNISQLIFEQKAVSILIQLDRPIYRQETVVQFRCIPIYPDLSGHFHTVDVYMIGPSGHILRKWENQQTTAGIVSLEVKSRRLSAKNCHDFLHFLVSNQ